MKLIPFLIVVLGVDNMFVLTSAVSNTSINLPVKERVAEGLAQSGVGIFINLMVELGLCGGLYLAVSAQVIREMAVFSAVALVVDYIMQMTYFITVLSIDMHRLELADLLQQGSGAPPGTVIMQCSETHRLPRFLELFLSNAQGRQARTYSAIILIASNYLLYLLYGRDYFVPAFCSNINHAQGPKLSPDSPLTPSEAFWFLLGARLSEAIHVHIPQPIVLLFDSFGVKTDFLSTARASMSVLLQFVVFPISLTTFGLYALLTHLLKGADQLNTGSGTSSENEQDQVLDPSAAFQATDKSFQDSDIELLCLAGDGSAYASWCPLEKRVRVRSLDARRTNYSTLDLSVASEGLHSNMLRHLALDYRGEHLAAVSADNHVLIWRLDKSGIVDHTLTIDGVTFKPKKITSLRPYDAMPSSGRPQRSDAHGGQMGRFILVVDDGSLWTCSFSSTSKSHCTILPCNTPDRLKCLVHPGTDGTCYAARFNETKLTVEAWSIAPNSEIWTFRGLLNLQNTGDSVSSWALHDAQDSHPIVIIGRTSGVVEVWDMPENRQVFLAKLHDHPVRHIRPHNLPLTQCSVCQSLAADTILLATSDQDRLRLSRLYSGISDACDCEVILSGNTSAIAQTPSASHSSSPIRKNGAVRAISEDTGKALAYPLSPHALRRLSHAADKKKPEESQYREESNGMLGEANALLTPPRRKVSSESRLESLTPPIDPEAWSYVNVGHVPLGPRSRWTTNGTRILGVRRISQRAPGASVLSRWEAWSTPFSHIRRAADGSLALESMTIDRLMLARQAGDQEPEESAAPLPFSHVRHLLLSRTGDVAALSFGNLVFTLSLQSVVSGAPLSRRGSAEYG